MGEGVTEVINRYGVIKCKCSSAETFFCTIRASSDIFLGFSMSPLLISGRRRRLLEMFCKYCSAEVASTQ